MTQPIVTGSQEHRVLVELQKEVCAVQVVLSRLDTLTSNGNEGEDFSKRLASSALQGMQDYALLMHLHSLLRWTEEAKQRQLIPSNFGSKLSLLAEHVTFVRNKRVHWEEYLGTPKEQKTLRREALDEDTYILTPPTWSSTINGTRKLGGRLVVSDVQPAILELEAELKEYELWSLLWDATHMIEADKR